MTAHAMERIAMRMPGLDPARALADIRAAHRAGTLRKIADSCDPTKRVCYWPAPGGKHLFPVVTDAGEVVTVLTEGMEALTPTGRVVLSAPKVEARGVPTAGQKVLASGVYADISDEVYHGDPCERPSLSSTLARVVLDQSPLHAWHAHPRLNPAHESRNSKTFDIGKAIHRAVLGKGGDYVAIPGELLASNGAASTKEAKAYISDARASGLIPLKAEEVDEIGFAAEAVLARLSAMNVRFDPARSEMSAIAEIDGVLCRCRPDNAPVDPRLPLYDIKSTTDASPEAVIRAIAAYGYDTQAAFYLDAWKAATGETRRFRFVFVEKAAPYEVAVVELYDHEAMVTAGRATNGSEESLAADWMLDARSKAAEARRIWGECLAANRWPGYPAQVAVVGAPSWHSKKWADREIGRPVIAPKPAEHTLARAAAWQAPMGATQ